ncbi:MAG: sigma-54-dependent Fis family transcriptional regulator, partial [Desulfobacteraceae bacterium]
EKGGYTSSVSRKMGKFEIAEGGTIFLDEIGDMDISLQAKLLRVLQQKSFERLGGTKAVTVNVRVIAATNMDLQEMIRRKQFREDLFYRIRVIHLELPSLKQRREDIPLLVDHLIAKFNRLQGKDIAGISGEVMTRLMGHDFPGNCRELENILEQAFVLCHDSIINLNHLPPELRLAGRSDSGVSRPMSLVDLEKGMIGETLKRCNGNRRQAARELGIDPSTLYRKLKALRIKVPEKDGRSQP